MRLLLVQLSDSHIRSDTDPLLSRAKVLAAGIQGAGVNIELCLIVYSGDLASTGAEAEYELAHAWLSELKSQLQLSFGSDVPVEFVLVPGNHDCDFSTPLASRDLLIAAVAAKPEMAGDESIVRTCTEVQDHFFAVRDRLAPGNERDNRLYYERRLVCGEETITIRCCNTAWMSAKHEVAGTLLYPVDYLPFAGAGETIAITVFHHPYNWLAPNNMRAFRKRVEAVSDIVFTGHEHDRSQRAVASSTGEYNLYIEASALHEHSGGVASFFNVLLIDTSIRKQHVLSFSWNGELYAQGPASDGWEDYQVNRLRSRTRFELSVEMNEELEDAGVTLTHATQGHLRLSQIFVYPDLREVTYKVRDASRVISGETILFARPIFERLLITGVEKAGKTCLAKSLYRKAHESGLVPVLLDGKRCADMDEPALTRYIEQSFEFQYHRDSLDHFRQLDRSQRVILVDNYNSVAVKATRIQPTVKLLTGMAGRVVLFANDLLQQLNDIAGTGNIAGDLRFNHYRIMEHGHVRREELAERWFALDPTSADDADCFAQRLVEAKKVTDAVVGKQFVPSYPVFLIALLQAQDHGQQLNLSPSTYGYFYELLIMSAIAQGQKISGLDVRVGFLIHAAFEMFSRSKSTLTDQELRQVFADYEARYALKLSFGTIQNELASARIWVRGKDEFAFSYPYFYFYFVARYLSERIADAKVQAIVEGLSARLHEEEAANILLFLAHLSKDPLIIRCLVAQAKTIFAQSERAELRREQLPFEAIGQALNEIVYEDRGTDGRKIVLRRLDESEVDPVGTAVTVPGRQPEDPSFAGEFKTVQNYLVQVGVALKAIQILGQILKNFPGSIEGPTKQALVEECFSLGLRTLGSILGAMRDHSEEFTRHAVEQLRQENAEIGDKVLIRKAQESLFGLAALLSYGFIRRISYSVGSPDLLPVYEIVRQADGSPAIQLISAALQLEQQGRFPTDEIKALHESLSSNILSDAVLRQLVVTHFHMFNVPYDTKQSICNALGIEYRRVQGSNPVVKLIEPARH